jgi:tripartite-type tricarboxylate transporter receptor subunit TctC
MLVIQGTPPPLVEALHARVTAILQAEDVRQRLEATGFTPVTGTRADLTKHISDDIARLKTIITATGVKIE